MGKQLIAGQNAGQEKKQMASTASKPIRRGLQSAAEKLKARMEANEFPEAREAFVPTGKKGEKLRFSKQELCGD